MSGEASTMNPVRVSNSYMSGMISNDALRSKMEQIEKCIDTPVLMLGMTGFSDYREMAQSLFYLMALIEMQDQAYLDTDKQIVSNLLKCADEELPMSPQKTNSGDKLQVYLNKLKMTKILAKYKLDRSAPLPREPLLEQVGQTSIKASVGLTNQLDSKFIEKLNENINEINRKQKEYIEKTLKTNVTDMLKENDKGVNEYKNQINKMKNDAEKAQKEQEVAILTIKKQQEARMKEELAK